MHNTMATLGWWPSYCVRVSSWLCNVQNRLNPASEGSTHLGKRAAIATWHGLIFASAGKCSLVRWMRAGDEDVQAG